jgi:hypothetical protein
LKLVGNDLFGVFPPHFVIVFFVLKGPEFEIEFAIDFVVPFLVALQFGFYELYARHHAFDGLGNPLDGPQRLLYLLVVQLAQSLGLGGVLGASLWLCFGFLLFFDFAVLEQWAVVGGLGGLRAVEGEVASHEDFILVLDLLVEGFPVVALGEDGPVADQQVG